MSSSRTAPAHGLWGTPTDRRNGTALIGVLVVLAVLSILMASIARGAMATRRLLEHRHYRLQADWLARSGIEQAVGRLLVEPAGYGGELLQLVPRGQVRIVVSREGADTYRIISEAHYPLDRVDVVVRTIVRRFARRVTEAGVQWVPTQAEGRMPEKARTTS